MTHFEIDLAPADALVFDTELALFRVGDLPQITQGDVLVEAYAASDGRERRSVHVTPVTAMARLLDRLQAAMPAISTCIPV